MAIVWEGKSLAVQQVTTWTISSNTNTHTFILTAHHPSGSISTGVQIVSETADGVLTTTEIATNIVAEWNASNHEFARVVTATNVNGTSNVVTFTSDYPGMPFIVVKTGTGTSTLTTTTANSGPHDFSVPSNFKGGAVPGAGAEVLITGSVPIKYGLDQDGATWDKLQVRNYSGSIGAQGTPMLVDVDEDMIFEDSTAECHVWHTTATTLPRLFLKNVLGGTIAAPKIHLNFGQIGVAMTVTKATIENSSARIGGSQVEECTISAMEIRGSALALPESLATCTYGAMLIVDSTVVASGACDLSTFILVSGLLQADDAVQVTTATVEDGTLIWNSSDAIATLNGYGGLLDFTQATVARTIATLNQQQKCRFRRDRAHVTVTTTGESGPFEVGTFLNGP